MPTFRHLPVLAAAVVLLAGCTASPDGPSRALSVSPSPSAAATEGPASVPHRWPNGLTVQVTKLERVDPKHASELKPGEVPVKVTVTIGNTGTAPFAVNPDLVLWRVLAGVNRFETGQAAGWAGEGVLHSPVPTQIAPGTQVSVSDTSAVPGDQLAVLAVRVDMGWNAVEPFTFVGCERLLAG